MRIISFMLVLIITSSVWGEEKVQISFGVVPQQSASKLARLWTPICKFLSDYTGFTYNFKTAKDIPTFEKRVSDAEYDIAYMNPYHYAVFSKKSGYQAFAKETNKYIQGIIVVKTDSPLQSIKELNGKRLAFPAPAAFAATVLPQTNLKNQQIHFNAHYVGSHDSVYLAVFRGLFPAGGGIVRTLNNMPQTIRDGTRILWETPKYTPHAFAAAKRVSKEVIEASLKGLIAMGNDPIGQKYLANLNFKKIGPAIDKDWDDVRGLQIERLGDM